MNCVIIQYSVTSIDAFNTAVNIVSKCYGVMKWIIFQWLLLEGKLLAMKYITPFYETSALTSYNVEDVFIECAWAVVRYLQPKVVKKERSCLCM